MKTKKTININNFNELKNFILSNDLTKNQIEDIIFNTIICIKSIYKSINQ